MTLNNPSYTDARAIAAVGGEFKIVRKTATKTLNNVAVLENDNHLLMALLANELWLVETFLLMSVRAASDIQFGWSYPAACNMRWGSLDTEWGSQSDASWLTEAGTLDILTAGNPRLMCLKLIATVINGANAGTLNLQWAQKAAVAEDTQVTASSCLIAHKIV